MALTISRRSFAAGAALLPIACASRGYAASRPARRRFPPAPDVVNPVVKNRADAQVFRHSDGWYYLTGSVPEYDRLVLRRARTLEGLHDAEERVLWRHEASGPMSGFIWAPELHQVDGRWYMYFAAGPSGGGEDVFRIRTYAVVCDGPDPMTGKWRVAGQFQAPWDSFNLDSTMFVHRGVRYFCWAQREPGIETNSNLYLAPMASPLTLAAKPVRLSVPTLPWEIRGFKVNEAPAFLEHEGRVFISYSASATDARYCLGLLWANADSDMMDAKSWTKSQEPVFTSCPETGVYGPGHNSFTVDAQGHPILVYHGRDYAAIKGDPLFDPNRHTRIQRLYFKPDGMPDFGVPVGNGPMPERFAPLARPGAWLAHDGMALKTTDSTPLPNTQFRSLDAGGGAVRLSPILLRDHALAATAAGGVELVPLAQIDSQPGGGRFRRVAGDGAGTVCFLADGSGGKALALTGGGIGLAVRNARGAQWRPD
ncbi:MAG TPA: glycoside hydrolase family 43 protein [Sphingomonas sp.]|nr:glycoside hydrolase family 43 protein [Sphingomonas sp.]